MLPKHALHGLVAATHTPFTANDELNLPIVEQQASHLLNLGVQTVFIGGTTGECKSLSLDERLRLTERWIQVVRNTSMHVVVHVGSDAYPDACTLAKQAERLGATAISAFAPSYFKPRSLETLVAFCSRIAEAAPSTPFYFYDIPALTAVHFPMADFLQLASSRIPNFAGLKFTNPDLMSYQSCLHAVPNPIAGSHATHPSGAGWDLPFGVDEHLLGALSIGAKGAVGSGYNFAAPIYQRLLAAFGRGDLNAAREEQFRGVRIVKTLNRYGYMGGAKAVMKMLGVDVGPARLPNVTLTPNQTHELHQELDQMGFFEWID